MRLNELFEQPGKTVAVNFGRMNPPTIGHEKLVGVILKQKADAHFLFVSQTEKLTGKNKTRRDNPIPFSIKLGLVKKAFSNIPIGDTSANTVIKMMQLLESQGYKNVIYVCGQDRVPEFETLLKNQNGIDYNFDSIEIVSSGDRDPDAEGAEGMSASKMRQAAIDDDFDSFKLGVPTNLQGNAEEIFSMLRKYLEPWIEENIKSEEYADEHIGKVQGGYRLYSKSGGKNLGTYPTRAGAEKRERQVQYFKHKG